MSDHTQRIISDVMRQMGAKGGKARLKTMTKKQRAQSARKAAKARWRNEKKSKG